MEEALEDEDHSRPFLSDDESQFQEVGSESPVVSLLARFKAKRYLRNKRTYFERMKQKFNRHWNSLRTPKEEEGLDFDPQYSKLYSLRENEMTSSFRQKEELMKWVVAFIIAGTVSVLAVIVEVSIKTLSTFKFKELNLKMKDHRIRDSVVFYFGINLGFVAVAAVLVAFLDIRAKGSGIPEIKGYLNGRRVHRVIAIRTLFSKVIGVVMSVSGSLVLGKEGPMIHAGGVIGAAVSQGSSERSYCGVHFRSDNHKRSFVSIGCACGIAAAFSAPLGGVLFVIEEASSYWSVKLTWITFFATMVCSATVDVFTSALVDDAEWGLMSQSSIVSFGSFEGASRDVCYPQQLPYRFLQIPIFIAIGVVGGVAGAVFNAVNLWLSALRQRHVTSPVSKVIEALLVCTLTSLVMFRSAYYFECRPLDSVKYTDSSMDGIGYNSSCDFLQLAGGFCTESGQGNDLETLMMRSLDGGVKQLFHSKVLFDSNSLVTYFIALYMLACLTYGTSIPSGLFVPAIAMGAAAGRLTGQYLFLLEDSRFIDLFGAVDPGTYALLGGASMLGGVTRMTISIVVILIETTNNSTYAIPIMITIMSAKVVGDIFTDGLYEMHLKLQRILFLHDEPHPGLHRIQVRDCMTRDPVVIHLFETVADALDKLESNPTINGFPVISHLVNSQRSDEPGLTSHRSLGSGYDAFQMGSSNNESSVDDDLDDSSREGIFEGVILRSQLLILLFERVFRQPHQISYKGIEIMPWRRMYKHYPRYPHLNDVLSRIKHHDLNKIMDFRPYVNSGALSVHHSVYMTRVHQLFRLMGIRHLTVVNTMNNVVGIVTRADIHRAESMLERGRKIQNPRVQPRSRPILVVVNEDSENRQEDLT